MTEILLKVVLNIKQTNKKNIATAKQLVLNVNINLIILNTFHKKLLIIKKNEYLLCFLHGDIRV